MKCVVLDNIKPGAMLNGVCVIRKRERKHINPLFTSQLHLIIPSRS